MTTEQVCILYHSRWAYSPHVLTPERKRLLNLARDYGLTKGQPSKRDIESMKNDLSLSGNPQ